MYILDTNVVSEMMKAAAHPAVRARVSSLPQDLVFTTSITSAEVFAGVARLPAGRRRDGLHAAAEAMFATVLKGRVLPFDEPASRAYAAITSTRKTLGLPIGEFDAQIAAIAATNRYTLLTRNVPDFEHCGFPIVDPWSP